MSIQIQGPIRCKKGEYGFDWSFPVKNNNGTAFNLTDYTITFKAWREDIPESPIINGAGAIVGDATLGNCKYTVISGDTDTAGEYLAELELTKTNVNQASISYRLIIEESA